MEKLIIENGGRLIEDSRKAIYELMEDGFDNQIWFKKLKDEPECTNVVHFRFVEACIEQKAVLRCEESMHLWP